MIENKQNMIQHKKEIIISSVIVFIVYSLILGFSGVSTDSYNAVVSQLDSTNKALNEVNAVKITQIQEINQLKMTIDSIKHPKPSINFFTATEQIHDWYGDSLSIQAKWIDGKVYWTVTSSTMHVHNADRLYIENEGTRIMLCVNPKWISSYDSYLHRSTSKSASGVTEKVSLDLWNSVVADGYLANFGYYAISKH